MRVIVLCFLFCAFLTHVVPYPRQPRQRTQQNVKNRNITNSHLESDERNSAGFDFCNAPAPAEAVQFPVGLEGYLG